MDEFQGYGFVVCGKENTMGKLGFYLNVYSISNHCLRDKEYSRLAF